MFLLKVLFFILCFPPQYSNYNVGAEFIGKEPDLDLLRPNKIVADKDAVVEFIPAFGMSLILLFPNVL